MAPITYSKNDSCEMFVNPYHFVPLGQKCDRRYNYQKIKEESGLLTGWIECELETKSPVFIPNSSNDDVFKERAGKDKVKSYDFFSREDLSERFNPPPPDHPVIPGSELRGVIRSAFEAVTNSCMSTTDDERVLFKRTTTPGHPGIVQRSEDGKWYLQPCQERIGVAAWRKYQKYPKTRDAVDFSEIIDEYSEGEVVSFDKSTRKYRNTRGAEAFFEATSLGKQAEKKSLIGFLHKGEYMHNKHHESIFVQEDNKKKIELNNSDLENLICNYKLYFDDKINQSLAAGKHNGYKSFLLKAGKCNADELELNDLDNALVYFKQVGSLLYLCPAAIGREVFHNRLRDLIGTFAPCETSDMLCPACALFGFVSGGNSVASRVRFGDAELIQPETNSKSLFLDAMVIPELASPKPSATEFYLKRPSDSACIWNYDYAGNWNRNTVTPLCGYSAQIQGRKFYWHGGKVRNLGDPKEIIGGEHVTKRHLKVRPVRDGVLFGFKVYFDEITENELKRLLWVLSVGNSSKNGHKIGMGKSVGLGSVTIMINDVIVRSVRIIEGGNMEYKTLSRGDLAGCRNFHDNNIKIEASQLASLLGGDCESIKAFLEVTNLENDFKDVIDYPRLDPNSSDLSNKKAIFHWFVGNKQVQGTGGTGVKPKIDQVLPPINEPRLKKIKAVNLYR